MNQDDPKIEFLLRLERGEVDESFLQELTKLLPEHRADIIEALFKQSKRVREQKEEPE